MMTTIKLGSQDYMDVEELLGENPEDTNIEMVTGIDCDDEDIERQEADGVEDPMSTIELIAQWNPDTKEGILDWYYTCVSAEAEEEPDIHHGGPLIGFRYTTEAPEFDELLNPAVEQLNEVVEWAEFHLNEEEA
ncbi:hypothetical protein [Rubritalea marina]|uniref:hypothetical protein n=1 Tax=Rubritalea marina TaxID=361055 RepID=UPI0012E9DB65|nr:hypothetical protein [Rubritalea marina]